MVIGGYVSPWKSEELLSLTWENIADLSTNFVQANKDVIIDYVAFPAEVEKFSQKIYAEVENAEIIYVVLWVDVDELLRRDALRIKEHQMGVRCLELINEFASKGIDNRFVYNTTNLQPTELDKILLNIRQNPAFKYWVSYGCDSLIRKATIAALSVYCLGGELVLNYDYFTFNSIPHKVLAGILELHKEIFGDSNDLVSKMTIKRQLLVITAMDDVKLLGTRLDMHLMIINSTVG